MTTIVQFPPRRRLPATEDEAWNQYLDAVAVVQAEHPNVNVSSCRRVVESYERFCFLMSRGPRRG